MKSKSGNHIDTKELLELAVSLGYHLQMCGAEIFRIEEAVNRLLQAYDTPGDVFVIPHCIIVTVCPDNDEPMTRMRRSYSRGIDIDGITFKEPAVCGIEGHYTGDDRGEHGIPIKDCKSGHTYTCECGWTIPDGGTYFLGLPVRALYS